jgi:hypothetical protein
MPTFLLLSQLHLPALGGSGPDVSEAWRAISERLGARVYTLFDLTVTHPVLHTWHLAAADLDVTGTVYRSLILEHSGVAASAALGGVGGVGGVSLTLDNALGTGDGPGKKFMDTFVTPVPGYSEPYDLYTTTLRARIWWTDLPLEPLIVADGLLFQPDGFALRAAPGEPETVHMAFGQDQRRYRPLPRTTVSTQRYPHAPDGAIDQPVPVWFGSAAAKLRVPLVPLDTDGGLYLIGASPAATPLGGVSKLWTIRPNPGAAESDDPIALPVQLTTAGQSVLDLAGDGTDQLLDSVAQRFVIDGDGAFLARIRVRLKKVDATAPAGSLSFKIVLEADGLPGETLVDPAATAEVNAAVVTSTSYSAVTVRLLDNSGAAVAAFAPGHRRGLWCVIEYAKANESAGGLHIEVHSGGGTYRKGMLATRTEGGGWVLTGDQHRQPIVRDTYEGGGSLAQHVTFGNVYLKEPVSVPGF